MEVVGVLAAVDGDGARGVDADGVVVRLPGAGGPVLGGAVGVLGGLALGGGVAGAGSGTGHVEQHEAHRPADGGVGPVAGTEGTDLGVEAHLRDGVAVNDDQRRHRMGGGVDAPQVQALLAERPHGGRHDREHLRRTAGHDGVDGNGPTGGRSSPGWQHGEDLVRVQAAEHRTDAFFCGRHDRQSVAPLTLRQERIQRLGGLILDLVEPFAHAMVTKLIHRLQKSATEGHVQDMPRNLHTRFIQLTDSRTARRS